MNIKVVLPPFAFLTMPMNSQYKIVMVCCELTVAESSFSIVDTTSLSHIPMYNKFKCAECVLEVTRNARCTKISIRPEESY